MKICARDGCNLPVNWDKARYCSRKCSDQEWSRIRQEQRIASLPRMHCQRCGEYIEPRKTERRHIYVKRQYCWPCVLIVRSLRMTSHEMFIAKRAGQARRRLAGKTFSDEHRANLSASLKNTYANPVTRGRQSILQRHRLGRKDHTIPSKICEGCGTEIVYDREKHGRPSVFAKRVTCSHECRYKVGPTKAAVNNPHRVPIRQCEREGCSNTFRSYKDKNKRCCSQACWHDVLRKSFSKTV